MLSIDTIAAQELDAYKDRDDVLIIDLRDREAYMRKVILLQQ